MRFCMKKSRSLKVGRYAECLIGLNEYLASFTGETIADNMGVTELNEILSNSMPNIWSKKAFVQGFDCEIISLKKTVICLSIWKSLKVFMKAWQHLLIKNHSGRIQLYWT